jgi:hypothetical protein
VTNHLSSPLTHAVFGFVATLALATPCVAADAPAATAPDAAQASLAAPAAADAPAPSAARALFKEARELAAKGEYLAACPKFEKSMSLEPGLGTQFNLADCWEHIGRTMSAQALFVGAAASAKAAGQVEREQVLRERAAALEPRIPRLVIEVEGFDPKLTVKRGDLPLDSDVYGKAKPVDPGSYDITAKAPGKKPWTKTVDVPPGASIVTVTVPALELQTPEPESTPAPEAKKAEAKLAALPASDSPSSVDRRSNGPSWGVLGLGTLGIGGLALGAIMAVKYSSANADAKNICPSGTGCSSQQIADHDRKVDDSRTARTWSYVGFGVGGASLAAAAALIFLPQKRSESAWVATPLISQGSLGASLSGRF